MNKKLTFLIIISLFIIGVGAFLYFYPNVVKNEEVVEESVAEDIAPMSDEDLEKYMEEENSKLEEESEEIVIEKNYDMSAGTYIDYSKEAYDEAIEDRKIVLFFHAVWCPTCKEANTNFEKNIDQVPDGVTILKVDYDTETELKKEYGITYQHTFVQVDEDGAVVSRWAGGDLQELKDNLK